MNKMTAFYYVFYLCILIFTHETEARLPVIVRIIGGNDTTIEDHPWQVSIQLFRRHFCSGSIISNDTILTAAHCITELVASSYQIIAGQTDISAASEPVYRVERYITHKDYVGDNMNFDYDIGILKLTSNLTFSSKVQPIALPEISFDLPQGTNVIVSGWGVTKEGSKEPSKVLKDVSLEVVDREVCQKALSNTGLVTDNMICAGVPNGGKDACAFDSGGPLEYKGVQVGIVSWGDGCGKKGEPGVYTNVARLREWIRQQTGI